MAATHTVYQLPRSRNSSKAIPTIQATEILTPQNGVVTLFGYGITVRVDRGHLILKDGIGAARRQARLPRVRHGIRRLVVIGSDGFVSLAALRWLADQDAAFVMLDRGGSVLATTGPVHRSDARLRRAQALANQSGAALRISRELIDQKLAGQERVACDVLHDSCAVQTIASARAALTAAETIPAIRLLESQAASAYWSAWRTIPINYPRADLRRVPDHWRAFGTRQSPLSGSPRLAANPPNAILNYLYAVLESETRLAAAALGLDPGLGIWHVDTDARDSLACDLMEPVRPQVDAYLLDWLTREPLRREWFFEQRDGTCRLMGPFAVRLSETTATWGRAVAPIAEWVARTLWSAIPKSTHQLGPATRLTQRHKREAKGGPPLAAAKPAPRPPRICRTCGTPIKRDQSYCLSCAVATNTASLVEAAYHGRIAAQSREAQTRRAETQRRHAAELKAWNPLDKPDWLNEETYRERIQSRLVRLTVSTISKALGISEPYATDIRAGRRCPHPRHWQALARLVGVSADK